MKKLILIASICALVAACNGDPKMPDPAATPFPTPPAELMRPAKEPRTLENHGSPTSES